MATRRQVLTAGAAALFGGALASCSSSSSSAGSATSAGPGFPATVQTKFGAVTVPSAPSRVVALGWGDAETALALGAQPVGASDWLAFGGEGVGPWATGRYHQPPQIIGTMQPSYEQVAALHPDLILDVKSSGDSQRYQRLSQIAPTIGIPEGGTQYLTTMEQQVTMIATALGKADEGRKLLTDIDRQFKAAAAAHPNLRGKTVTVATDTAKGWALYVEKSERVQFMERLGMKASPATTALPAGNFYSDISDETLPTLTEDLMVVFPIGKKSADITSQPLYGQIPAVKSGHAVLLGDAQHAITQAYSLYTVLSVPYAIQNAVPLFAAAVA